MKVKENIKTIICCVICSLIVFAATTYAAEKYLASQIVFATTYDSNVKTVDDALNSLYDFSNNSKIPKGTIISLMGKTAPDGFLIADGKTYNIEDYKTLAKYFEEQFGKSNYFGGDGTTTFAVPDLRGEFLRGTGANSHANSGSGADVGEHQEATYLPRIWIWNNPGNSTFVGETESNTVNSVGNAEKNQDFIYTKLGRTNIDSSGYKVSSSSAGQQVRTGYSTRPTNTSVLYCIKY